MAPATNFKVDVELTDLAFPSPVPEHPAVFQASPLDLPGYVDAYIPILFLYKPDLKVAQPDDSILSDAIRTSLDAMLVEYYPFAGRWVKIDGEDSKRELRCNDKGAPFTTAFIDEEMDNVLNREGYTPLEQLGGYEHAGLDPTVWIQGVDTPLPPLFVQLTMFICGSAALLVSFHRQTTDDQGIFNFLQAWSKKGLHVDSHVEIETPTHDDSILKPLLTSTGDANPFTELVDSRKRPDLAGRGGLARGKEVATSDTSLHVKRETVDRLKAEAAESKLEVTTAEVISAHIWTSINNLPESIDKKTSTVICTWLDGRKRIHDPPLPELYSRSASVLTLFPALPAAELAGKSNLQAATLIHQTLKGVDPSTWQSCMQNALTTLNDQEKVEKSRLILINSWLDFPMYDLGFGAGFNLPVYATSNISNWYCGDAVITILPPPPDRANDTVATLQIHFQQKDGMAEALLSNEEFLSFFHERKEFVGTGTKVPWYELVSYDSEEEEDE